MGRIPGLRRLFRFPRRTARQIDREIDDELSFHLDMVAAELAGSGVSRDAAREEARRRFGDLERARRALRVEDRAQQTSAARRELLQEARADVRYGLRQMRTAPGFTAITVATLALGIGATTAIFSAVDGVLLRPLPYPDPERIVTLWQSEAGTSVERDHVSPANFLDWRERSRSFERLALYQPYGHDMTGDRGEAITVQSWLVSEGYFEILGVGPMLGRTFEAEEYQTGAPRVAVISHGLWQRRYGGDPGVIGRREILDRQPHTIVGVMPPLLRFPEPRDIWAPKQFTDGERQDRGGTYMNVLGRLRSGVSLDAARGEMERISTELAREYPRTNRAVRVAMTTLPHELVGPVRQALYVLFGAVTFVLLIACANVANLLLARGAERRRELAVRAALGAGRARLVRQLVTESGVLAMAACVVGLMLAYWGIRAILVLSPATLPRIEEVGLNGRVLVFALVTAAATALAFGLAPALQFSRPDLHDALKEGGRGTSSGRARRATRVGLIVGEIALAVVLLVGAGLLLRSFTVLLRVDPGFAAEERAMVQLFFWDNNATPERRVAFLNRVLDEVRAVPGVRSAAAVSAMPFADANIGIEVPIAVEGQATPADGEAPHAYATVATPGYFEAMGVALRRGRGISAADDAAAPAVAMISASLAERHWPGADPIGKRIAMRYGGAAPRTIVGVVADVRHDGLHSSPRQEVYIPHAQSPTGSMTIVTRTDLDPATMIPALREAVWRVDRAQPIYDAATLQHLVSESLRERRFHLTLLGSFALLSLLIAAIGVYGVISHATAARTQEFGVRIALGATSRGIVGAAMRDGVGYAVGGVLLGVAGALALTRVLRGMLYGVTPTDPLTFAALAGLVLAAACLACYVPARRALRVDPVDVLR